MLIREGREYRNRGETIKWWYSLETGSWFLLKEICLTMSFEFYRTGAPTQVEDGSFRLNTRFVEHSLLLHHQPIKKKKKKSQSPQPSPQMLPPVSGNQ